MYVQIHIKLSIIIVGYHILQKKCCPFQRFLGKVLRQVSYLNRRVFDSKITWLYPSLARKKSS